MRRARRIVRIISLSDSLGSVTRMVNVKIRGFPDCLGGSTTLSSDSVARSVLAL